MATWIKQTTWNDGGYGEIAIWSVEEIKPENGKDFKLKELQLYVGGYIEIVQLTNDELMIVNEEGKLEGLPLNPMATQIYEDRSFCKNDYICGNVVICKREQVK